MSRPHPAGRRRGRPDVHAKTGGTPESGVVTAPWDGIHRWYLKDDSPGTWS
ncbi:MAG: hypothetical protein KA371_01000 [Acidobacteria bacterium]|nr:hypothetical protein [Acidobacteriota bacterium]